MYELNKEREFQHPVIEWIIPWLAATAVGVAGLTTFVYMNFQTKEAFAEYRSQRNLQDDGLIKRLDRIEDKIDRLLSSSNK